MRGAVPVPTTLRTADRDKILVGKETFRLRQKIVAEETDNSPSLQLPEYSVRSKGISFVMDSREGIIPI